MRYSVEAYVDREAGTCSFDDPSFRSLMEFVQMLPGIEGHICSLKYSPTRFWSRRMVSSKSLAPAK